MTDGPDAVLPAESQVVLLAEDEVLVRLWLAMTLRDAGYVVVEASNADEALDIVASGIRPEALVTDVRMPGALDGLQLAKQLRDTIPALIVIVTSAHLASTSEAASIHHFFAKPYNADDIVARLTELLPKQATAKPGVVHRLA